MLTSFPISRLEIRDDPCDQTPKTNLVAQNDVPETGWKRSFFRDIELRLSGKSDFPCVFGINAFRKGLLKFIFVEEAGDAGIRYLALGLKEYVDISREWGGTLDTAYPLLVAFSTRAVRRDSIEAYHAFGWQVLQKLHELDPAPWPEGVETDPNVPGWSMCFNGMPIFCNMSSPHHQARRSRNLGEHFTMVVNPRERFDVVAGDTPSGHKIRANIRKRIQNYDGMPHCPQLASYGNGGSEWWQYGIIEENRERKDRCPFSVRGA